MIENGLKEPNLVNQIPLECPFNPYRDELFWTKDKDSIEKFIDFTRQRSNIGGSGEQVNSGSRSSGTRSTIKEPSDQKESSSIHGDSTQGHHQEYNLQNQEDTSDEKVVQSSNLNSFTDFSQSWFNQYFFNGHGTNDANNVREKIITLYFLFGQFYPIRRQLVVVLTS